MDFLVTGANGQLGRAVLTACGRRQRTARGCGHAELPVDDLACVQAVLGAARPRFVLHCGAWTDVDGCEREPERAMRSNATGTANVATVCAGLGIGLVYVSTDFVFDGSRTTPYSVTDQTGPVSQYGLSKLRGETAVLAAGRADFYVLRASWVFGPRGRNFPLAILNRARSGQPLAVVEDELGNPSLTLDLAEAMLDLCEHGAAPGVYHACNEGVVSRWQFAVDLLRLAGLGQIPVAKTKAATLVRPARRPAYSALDCGRLTQFRGKPLPHYLDALQRYLQEETP